uniref:Transcription factor TFIIB cyclin-like domain-containing protein n=1 Tax=Meloidogyne enterolobii TaxID=390850 RepID=A0A6V7W3W5_MELEN|nr:unnamed protein product [Meloidogyne enterolobii]
MREEVMQSVQVVELFWKNRILYPMFNSKNVGVDKKLLVNLLAEIELSPPVLEELMGSLELNLEKQHFNEDVNVYRRSLINFALINIVLNLHWLFQNVCYQKLTRGRLRSHVVVACLYMACRSENTSHLLLDFSDATQINIFDLGRTLGFLSRSLL